MHVLNIKRAKIFNCEYKQYGVAMVSRDDNLISVTGRVRLAEQGRKVRITEPIDILAQLVSEGKPSTL
jgi:hypothetical protein